MFWCSFRRLGDMIVRFWGSCGGGGLRSSNSKGGGVFSLGSLSGAFDELAWPYARACAGALVSGIHCRGL